MDGEWGRTVTQTFATLWVARAGATPGVGPQLVILVRPPLAPSAKVDPVRVTPSPCPPRAAPPFIPRGNATEDRRHGPSCCWGGVPSRGSTSTCHGSGRPSPVYTPSRTRGGRRRTARPKLPSGSPGQREIEKRSREKSYGFLPAEHAKKSRKFDYNNSLTAPSIPVEATLRRTMFPSRSIRKFAGIFWTL